MSTRGVRRVPTANRLIIQSAMGEGRSDYEAVYRVSPLIQLSELHNHGFYEIFIHLHGGNNVYIDGQVYSQEPGTLMVYPPFQLHGIISGDELVNYERAFLYITPELMRRLGCDLIPFEQVMTERIRSGSYQYHLDEQARVHAVALLRRIADNSAYNSPEKRLEDYSYIIQFLLLICKTMCNQGNIAQPLGMNSFVRDVIRYIDGNFSDSLTLDALAAHFSVSKSYLCHEFKRTINSSVYQYMLFRRVTYAKELLAEGAQPMDVSDRCGFGNYSNFQRVFIKQVGCSPRSYRNMLRS